MGKKIVFPLKKFKWCVLDDLFIRNKMLYIKKYCCCMQEPVKSGCMAILYMGRFP